MGEHFRFIGKGLTETALLYSLSACAACNDATHLVTTTVEPHCKLFLTTMRNSTVSAVPKSLTYLSACRMTRPVMRLTGTVPSKHQLYPLAMTYSTDRSQVSYLSRRTGPHVDTSPLYSLVSYAFEYNHKPCAHRLSTFIPYVMILNPGSLTPMIPSSSPIPASSDGVALT
jgi:hypothetical protein